MKQNKSLVELAEGAGFVNIHAPEGRNCGVSSAIISDRYKMIYFRCKNWIVGPSVHVLGIVSSEDYKNCALYDIPIREFYRGSTDGGINLDKEIPTYFDVFARNILVRDAKNAKVKKSKK